VRIVGVLSWYDESPSWLAACVGGFARVCDEIVAVDGAYELYPGGRARSRPDQAEAIMIAAEAAGVGCTIHRPRHTFAGNEVEKRNLTLGLAAPLLEPMRDWLMVFDADMHVMQAYPDVIRRDLAETDRHVATMTLLDGQDMFAADDRAALARTHPVSTEWTYRARFIYRWLPELRYGPAHYSIRGTIDGEDVWLRGATRDRIEPQLDLGKALVVHHRSEQRAVVRRDAADAYDRMRDLTGVEQVENAEMLVS